MAIRSAATNQADTDSSDEAKEQDQRAGSPPPGGGKGNKHRGTNQFRERQEPGQRDRQGVRHSEVGYRFPGAVGIGQLGHSRSAENGGQDQASKQQNDTHK